MTKEKQSRFQLQPSIVAAIDKVRGRQPRQQFVEDAVLYKLAWHGQTPQLERKSCIRCGRSLPSDHAAMVYCSNACRTAAFQARRRRYNWTEVGFDSRKGGFYSEQKENDDAAPL